MHAVRFFCQAVAADSIPFRYARALSESRPIRVVSILGGMAAFTPGSVWYQHQDWFGGVIEGPYINVVCAPPGVLLGSPLRASEMMPPQVAKLTGSPADAPDEVVYTPQTAFCGLYTVGVPNLAITGVVPKPPRHHELACLRQYDTVVAPSTTDREALRLLGIDAMYVPAERDALEAILCALETRSPPCPTP